MLYLIDADIFCYRSASAAEQQYHWQEDDVWTLLMDMNDARDAFQTMVRHVTDTLGEGQMLFCLSDPNDNFRKRVCADYKGNRGRPESRPDTRHWSTGSKTPTPQLCVRRSKPTTSWE